MMILITIAFLIGIVMLIIGAMLLGAPEELYKLNRYIIKTIYKINEYFNKKLFEISSYFNNLIVSKDSVLTYRLVIGAMYLIVGLALIYSSYYYSQQGSLPPMIQNFFNSLYAHFQSPDVS